MDDSELIRMKDKLDRDLDPSCYPDSRLSIGENQIEIINSEASGLSLDFGVRQYNDLVKWGARVTDCEIRLHHPKKSGFYCSTLERCRLIAMQPQVDPNWVNVHWLDCQLEGVFSSCSFGRISKNRCFQAPLTRMERCDFSKARLDACPFLNINPEGLIWPELPHLIVHEPWRHAAEILAIHRDQPLQNFLQSLTLADDSLSALALSLEWIRGRGWLSESDIERFIATCRELDFVTLNF
ncbi:hypothetical protein R5W24_006340 [Gemmata sp. JC717]|uniref:hypothetical protein n=1 Tax=Gemmata algarum TaxID=2975278 RepID=UPI0021BA5F18|nr:hypothetical protein [Gemmata algarum]MDY3557153.1 hypothetical protein [Gemmata algarum]